MKTSTLSILLLAISWNSAAMATPFNFDCSVPVGGNSEIWRMRPQAPPFRVRGRIRPLGLSALPPDEQERDGAIITPSSPRGIDVRLEDDSEGTAVNLGVGPGEGNMMNVGVVTSRGDRDAMRLMIERSPWREGDPLEISFEISVSASGRAVLRVGTREIPIDVTLGSDTRISVSCTGGHFWISDLEMDD